MHNSNFAPRALLRRPTVIIELTPFEAHVLIRHLESRAMRAASNPDLVDVADAMFLRVAQLREALR